MNSILKTHQLSKFYSGHTALKEVSISVPRQSIYGLLGPNGAGKTTLIRMINQIIAPDSGSIEFNGRLLKASDIASIGYMPEERGLYKKMEVGEQCVYLAQLKGLSRKEAVIRLRYWFDFFDIKNWWKKKTDELSKGMQQKVQFIVTILHQPELLILDEPFTGLDPINANLIKDELIKLRNNGSTIILSTHRLESIDELCTDVVLIDKSRKMLEGSIDEIQHIHKTNTYIVEYKGHAISLANSLWGDFEIVLHLKNKNSSVAHIRINENLSSNKLLECLIPNIEIISFKELIPTMNDVFITTVQTQQKANIL